MITQQLTNNTFKNKMIKKYNLEENDYEIKELIENNNEKQLLSLTEKNFLKFQNVKEKNEKSSIKYKLDLLNVAMYEKIENRLCLK